MSHLAKVEVCKDDACAVSHLLVRGDRIGFVSVEQVKRVGESPLNEHEMPSDINLPTDFVLVHDTSGTLFDRCHMHIVKWHRGRKRAPNGHEKDMETARKYFGHNIAIKVGEVDVPEGPWRRIAQIRFIRYRRQGIANGNYEHKFDPPVYLYSTQRPLAWKLRLPNGCIVDERGFVRP